MARLRSYLSLLPCLALALACTVGDEDGGTSTFGSGNSSLDTADTNDDVGTDGTVDTSDGPDHFCGDATCDADS